MEMIRRLAPNSPIMPDRLFWVWSLKSLFKGIYYGMAVGVVWMVFGLVSADPNSNIGKLMFASSFAIDTIMVFSIVSVCMLIGLMHNSWDDIFIGLDKIKGPVVRRMLWAIVIPLAMAVVIRYYMHSAGMDDNVIAVMAFNFMLTSALASTVVYRGYVYSMVYTEDELADMEYAEQEAGRFKAVLRIFRYASSRHRMGAFSLACMILMPLVALSAANWIAGHLWTMKILPLVLGGVMGFLTVLVGVFIRLFDIIKPYGMQESLYPHYELHLGRSERSSVYSDDQ